HLPCELADRGYPGLISVTAVVPDRAGSGLDVVPVDVRLVVALEISLRSGPAPHHDLTDAFVARVRDIDVAGPIHRHSPWRAEHRKRGVATVPGEPAETALSGNGSNVSFG